jgi:HpiC1 cyclase/PEP-CTERM motif
MEADVQIVIRPRRNPISTRLVYCLALLLVPSLSTSHANAVTITNPGFEDITGESQSNEFTFGPLNGWDLYDPDVITQGGDGPTFFIGTLTPNAPDFFTNGAPEGQRVGIAFNFFGSGGQGEYGLQQTLPETLLPSTGYLLSVDIGNIASGTSQGGQFFNLDGFPGYRIDVLADGVLIAQDDNSLAGLIPEGEFGTTHISFTTGSTPVTDYQIRLVNLNQIDPLFPNADLEVDFDNVRLDQDIIENFGDLSGDGFVGIDDLNIVLGNWNQNVPPANPLADPSGDNFVGIDDLNQVLGNWNAGTPPAANTVPEPTSLLFLSVGGFAMLRRRR